MSEVAVLEDAFKRSLLNVGLINRFYADVTQLGVQGYAGHAPSSKQLAQEVQRYMKTLQELEQRILLAKATLERDVRKAKGLSPLPTLSGTPGQNAETHEENASLNQDLHAQAVADDIAMQIAAPSFVIPNESEQPELAALLKSGPDQAPQVMPQTGSDNLLMGSLGIGLGDLPMDLFGSANLSTNQDITNPNTAYSNTYGDDLLGLQDLDSLLGSYGSGSLDVNPSNTTLTNFEIDELLASFGQSKS